MAETAKPVENRESLMMNHVLFVRYTSVVYNNRYGGVCPECKKTNCAVTRTMPWLQNEKVRYHKCECGRNFTSIEEEQKMVQITLPMVPGIIMPPVTVSVELPVVIPVGMSAHEASKTSKNRKRKRK